MKKFYAGSSPSPKFNNFHIKYYPNPRLASLTAQIIETNSHPLHAKLKENVSQRDSNSLWQLVSGNFLADKKVVRNKACRRLRQTFRETLMAHGYDQYGKRLDRGKKRSLRGTLEIHPFKSAILAKQDDLEMEMARLLNFVKLAQRVQFSTKASRAAPTQRLSSKGDHSDRPRSQE
ncbi:MAG: hypothetical protein LQ340_001513 [Diploschistes diacapsis]|nr:MAG: hypothetical protein LQ340_001513 [Diploschistes diacapsis]